MRKVLGCHWCVNARALEVDDSQDTGYTGVCVWDVIDYQDVPIPSLPAALSDRYVYTKSTWLQFEDSSVPIFVLGSMRGEVTLWRWVGNRRVSTLPMHQDHPAETLSGFFILNSLEIFYLNRSSISGCPAS